MKQFETPNLGNHPPLAGQHGALTGFDLFRFNPKVSAGIKSSGYAVPTPIQREAIPHALAGRDVLGLAQTGTGKTAAFALPILQKLIDGPRGRLRALIVAPTRELAEQIHVSFQTLAKETGLRSVTVYGGVGMGLQVRALRGQSEIAVVCPGRLLDHVKQGTVDLSGIEILVLDEADQMLDMGFLPNIRQILKKLPHKRQTMLFSATMPEDIRRLTGECLRDPVTVKVEHDVPIQTVAHALYPVREHLKTDLLLELLRRAGAGSILVFTRTKHRAKRLGQRLEKSGFSATSLQGNLSQNRRRQAMDGFRNGTYQVLVATDIAARGIDVSEVTHVINFDVPVTAEAYTHRIGRTGRAARTGDAFTLVTDQDASLVMAIERHMKRKIDRRLVEGFNYEQKPTQEPPDRGPAGHSHPRGNANPAPRPAHSFRHPTAKKRHHWHSKPHRAHSPSR